MRSLYFTVLCFAVPLPLLAADAPPNPLKPLAQETISKGRSLFLKNCAHCHADDATGDEGPDLHQLWSEALWGAGLIGGVLGVVAVLAVTFGR